MPLAALDVAYHQTHAIAACVEFATWTDATPLNEYSTQIDHIEPYIPGQFYRRELPCLLAVLKLVAHPLDAIIIDGYVTLNEQGSPGLGAHLYESLNRHTPVIGVAKTRFAGAPAIPITRGHSGTPLYITAVGTPVETAANYIRSMHGNHRIPTLLKRVDTLTRASDR